MKRNEKVRHGSKWFEGRKTESQSLRLIVFRFSRRIMGTYVVAILNKSVVSFQSTVITFHAQLCERRKEINKRGTLSISFLRGRIFFQLSFFMFLFFWAFVG